MTDKEKIHKVIEKRYEYWKEREFNSHSVESEIRMSECQHLLLMIDSLQEKPKPQFKVGDIIRNKVWEFAVHEIVSMDDGAYYFENGGMVRFADQVLWELVEEPVSEDLEKVAEEAAVAAFFVSPQWTKTGERLFKAGAEWQKKQDSMLPKIWPRKNLDDFAYQVAYDLSNDWMVETPTWDDVETAVKLGARWQKEKDQKK